MTRPLVHDSIATWLELRMSHHAPVEEGCVRLMGVAVIDPLFADADTAARLATWIGDGSTMDGAVGAWRVEFDRFDVVAAVVWQDDRPDVTIVIVNP